VFFSKGEAIMSLLPLNDCCLLLGIDPKTLRCWLKDANLSWMGHPTDARVKYLTDTQLQHLAHLHGRFLTEPLPNTPAPTPLSQIAPLAAPTQTFSQTELSLQLLHLQTQMATLQEQMTQLALSVLRSHEWRGVEHLSTAQSLHVPTQEAPALPVSTHRPSPHPRPSRSNPPPPRSMSAASSSSRSRSRVLPLIEYGVDGRYVVICPTRGVLSLVPDSPEWFEWLASLTGFTFQGTHGRFSTSRKFRNGQHIQAWNVYRSLHGRSCGFYLGLTSSLTIAHLEHMAAKIETHLNIL
jgi:hypothetical protein